MAGLPSASAIDAAEYSAIEATIAASERGRWFLAEHGRRARAEETRTVLDAITRLEQAVTTERPAPAGNLRGDLVEMAEAIRRTKAEITAITTPDLGETRLALASQALDAVVRATEQATSDILGAAEAVQEAAWTLRERHGEAQLCEALDRHATAIYTACSFQDLTAQRIARIIYTLRYLEDRIAAMIAIWGNEAERVPSLEIPGSARPTAEELCQLDVDRYIAMGVPAVTAAAISARPGSLALHEDIVFVPVSTGAEAAPAADLGVGFAGSPEDPAPAGEPEAAPTLPDGPSLDFTFADPPAIRLDALEAMPPQERLALFA